MTPATDAVPSRILVLDVGGSHVKAAFSDSARERRIPSGPRFTPERMVRGLSKLLSGESYDAVAVGYPGRVVRGRMAGEPSHLGKGWVGFDFEAAFGCPVRIVNDAAMQALGSYRGGHLLFLGLGTGLGSAMIVEGKLQPMELAHLPYKKGRTFEDYVGEASLARLGRKKWQKEVYRVVELLEAALEPDEVVLGGGNVRKLDRLLPGVRRGDNREAIVGGVRLWGGSGWPGFPGAGSEVFSPAPPSRPRTPRRRANRKAR
ncbi:MAG TPA: ROK family protein [Thermoplasmata archaeon]|nr:ROK family protein [Thermoplasmata archaeon]